MPETQTQNQSPQKHLHPGIWITVLVLFAATVGYLIWARESKEWPFVEGSDERIVNSDKNQENDSSPSEVEGWQTYRNEEYGFEVRYPNNLLVAESPPDPVAGDKFKLLKEITFVENKFRDETNPSFFRTWVIQIYENSKNLSAQTWFENNRGGEGQLIGGPIYIERQIDVPGSSSQALILSNETLVAQKGDIILNLFLDDQALFDQILSTFKFIDLADTSDWKTYRNEEYGFEVRYPSDWRGKLVDEVFWIRSIETISSELHEASPVIAVKVEEKTEQEIKEIFLGKLGNVLDFEKECSEKRINGHLSLLCFPAASIAGEKNLIVPGKNFVVTIVDTYMDKESDQILSTFKFTK